MTIANLNVQLFMRGGSWVFFLCVLFEGLGLAQSLVEGGSQARAQNEISLSLAVSVSNQPTVTTATPSTPKPAQLFVCDAKTILTKCKLGRDGLLDLAVRHELGHAETDAVMLRNKNSQSFRLHVVYGHYHARTLRSASILRKEILSVAPTIQVRLRDHTICIFEPRKSPAKPKGLTDQIDLAKFLGTK